MDNNYIVPGKYVVAVSGGVDSVVLLDLLSKDNDLDLIVTHVDHGIRKDSAKDAELVTNLAKKYKCPLETTELNLGADTGEELARQKRYEFLHKIMYKHKARAILTAHHRDDVLETALLNLIRGTGYRGLASLKSTNKIIRPLLNLDKAQIIKYAQQNNLNWQEDPTNQQTHYLRNKIRHKLITKTSQVQRQKLQEIIERQSELNSSIDREIDILLKRGLHKGAPVLNRAWFNKLPHDVSKEVVRKLLVDSGARDIDKKTIERITVAIKTLSHGKTVQAHGVNITLTKRSARLKSNSKTDKKQL